MDNEKLGDFLVEKGYRSRAYVLINVRLSDGNEKPFLFSSDEGPDVEIGDEVVSINGAGSEESGTVTDVKFVEEEDYLKFCKEQGYAAGLPKARLK